LSSQFNCGYLSEKLRRNGISPKRVSRVIDELRDHFQDLKTVAIADGKSEEDAAVLARSKLGTEEVIANEILARPELRSWTARWPWVFYALLPFAMMLGTIVLGVLTIVVSIKLIEGSLAVTPTWLESVVSHVATMFMYVAPIALTTAICWIAISRRSSWIWPTVGVVAIAIFGGSFETFFGWAEGGELSSISVISSLIWPFPDTLVATTIRASVNMLLVLGPYLYWVRSRRQGFQAAD